MSIDKGVGDIVQVLKKLNDKKIVEFILLLNYQLDINLLRVTCCY